MAGLDGALVPRWAGPLPKLSDSSGPPVGGADPGTGPGETADPGAGGGGMLGGPPGIGCCCRGGCGRAAGGKSLGSTSSHSEDKSPELNLPGKNSRRFRKLTLLVKLLLKLAKDSVPACGSCFGGAQIRPHPASVMALIVNEKKGLKPTTPHSG